MTQTPDVVRGREAMIAGMTPVLQDETWCFCTTDSAATVARLSGTCLALCREREGTTLVLSSGDAERHGLDTGAPMSRIILEVFSALDGVGLTAAVATALADRGIPCNVIAAYHHDHVFVPSHLAEEAVGILQDLQKRAAPPGA